MKKSFVLFFLLIPCLSIFSQDKILLMNGQEVTAQTIELTATEVKYKLWENQQGPLIVIAKSDIYMITFANGYKEVFNEPPSKNNVSNTNVSANNLPTNNGTNTVSVNNTGGNCKIEAGTSLPVELLETISSKTLMVGQRIPFRVKQDIKSGEKVMILGGTNLYGRVQNVKEADFLGKEGSVEIRIDSVQAVDNQWIQLGGIVHKAGQNREGASLAVGILLFWPALFLKGKEAQILSGTVLYVDVVRTQFINVP